MMMHIGRTTDRDSEIMPTTTTWKRSLFFPSTICYCGIRVIGGLICPECSERMSRAFQRALLARPSPEATEEPT